ncbi:hypothetical protein I7I53_05532 [Histoplasma capsulatum var. duboisii H88]|uniref:C3H1-type domain-containing protein n=1 Tax=Ajellomyces capsulatus (strain H88) TaxID=544711 RepID=A0A8A1LT70_AJEC8|nr:hypothetical protein I7I53_05532 [Histoplasma capsulatum var. duboisii H88]
MHTSRTQKKATACYYWYNGRCKYTADACMYAHRDTGQVAKRPPLTTKLESKPDQRDTRDLISLVGNDDIMEDTISTAAATENSSCTIVLQTPAESSECLTLAEAVIKALQSNMDSNGIKAVLVTNPPERVRKALNKGIDGFSAIFEAVKRNDADIIELLVENGANPNATEHNSDIPLLAFAILRGATITIIQTLLSLGANPHSIPRDLWGGSISGTFDNDIELLTGNLTLDTRWYNRLHRASLLKRLDFGLRYHLLASSKLETPTKKERRNAERLGIKSLLQLPYFSVGQRLAIKRVTEYVQSHLLLPSGNRPLMLAFVGPPGHGQLKLAASVGKVVPFNSIVARTKKMNNYSANEQIPDKEISTNKPGKLEVVYIDDIDKIGRLNLITLLNGPTQASSKTICILSVTDGESTILDFYETYLGNASKDELLSAPWDELDKALKKGLLKSYGFSLTSHIDAIIPFFPYSDSEAEALAYKYINDLRSRLANADVGDNAYAAKPATANASTFLSAIHLDLEGDDRAICEHIAKKSYDMNLGERSIQQGVIREIQLPIIEQWIKKIPEAEESFRGYGQAPWCSGLDLGSPHSSTSMSTSGGAHALSAQGVTKAAVKLVANEHPDVVVRGRKGHLSISVSLE